MAELHVVVRLCFFSSHADLSRLLDAIAVPLGMKLDLTLVFEYIDQDLSTYLTKVPASGLSRDRIRVCIHHVIHLIAYVQLFAKY